MKMRLLRYINSNGWIYGKIEIDNVFFCDSLELEGEYLIKDGIYEIVIGSTTLFDKEKIIVINQDNDYVTEFVEDNTYYYKNIRIRYDNEKITVGLISNYVLPVMSVYKLETLMKTVKKEYYSKNKIEIEIKTCF